MRFVQLKLKEASFWGIPDVNLFIYGDMVSDVVDLQSIGNTSYGIIKESYDKKQICVLDLSGNVIALPTKEEIVSDKCDISDFEDDTEEEFNVVSVTIPNEESNKKPEPSVEHYEKAEIILLKNGNTIRKIIKNLKLSQESFFVLMALKEIESQDKQRKGVLKEIDIKMGEIND